MCAPTVPHHPVGMAKYSTAFLVVLTPKDAVSHASHAIHLTSSIMNRNNQYITRRPAEAMPVGILTQH